MEKQWLVVILFAATFVGLLSVRVLGNPLCFMESGDRQIVDLEDICQEPEEQSEEEAVVILDERRTLDANYINQMPPEVLQHTEDFYHDTLQEARAEKGDQVEGVLHLLTPDGIAQYDPVTGSFITSDDGMQSETDELIFIGGPYDNQSSQGD